MNSFKGNLAHSVRTTVSKYIKLDKLLQDLKRLEEEFPE